MPRDAVPAAEERQRHADRSQSAILAAARDQFAEHGLGVSLVRGTGLVTFRSCRGSPCGPVRLRAQAGVPALVQAASLDCGPRLRLHLDPRRRGRDQSIHSF